MDRNAEVGIRFDPYFFVCPFIAFIAFCVGLVLSFSATLVARIQHADVSKPAVILDNAFQHFEGIFMVLIANGVPVVTRVCDFKDERLAPSLCSSAHFADDDAGCMFVQFVNEGDVDALAIKSALFRGDRTEERIRPFE